MRLGNGPLPGRLDLGSGVLPWTVCFLDIGRAVVSVCQRLLSSARVTRVAALPAEKHRLVTATAGGKKGVALMRVRTANATPISFILVWHHPKWQLGCRKN
jgi:hypothetical protein